MFELETRIAAEPSAVIDFMVDLSRHRGLHPFFVTAQVTDSGADVTSQAYEAHARTYRLLPSEFGAQSYKV